MKLQGIGDSRLKNAAVAPTINVSVGSNSFAGSVPQLPCKGFP